MPETTTKREPTGLSKKSAEAKSRDEDKKAVRAKPTGKAKSQVEEHNAALAQEEETRVEKTREEELEEARAALEALDPTTSPLRWVIGKAPEHGGTEQQYSVYVQDKLPWIPRQRFFALVGKTVSAAIAEAGSEALGMSDILGDGRGTLIERGRRLTQRDFGDAASFMRLAMELVAYSPDFLLDCYCIWLNVPRDERGWAKLRFEEPWKPDQDKWGLSEEQHEQIVQTFIDQNYEDIRRFFVVTLPALAKRVALHEKAKERETKDRDSE